MKWRSLLAGILLLCAPLKATAQLDPELEKPYVLQVVLHVAENRFLTPIFQVQLQRSLRDHLQLTLGALAKVEVVRSHPLLSEIEAKGLETGPGWLGADIGAENTFRARRFRRGNLYAQGPPIRRHDAACGVRSRARREPATEPWWP